MGMSMSVDDFRNLLAHQRPADIVANLYRAAALEREEPETCAILANALMRMNAYEGTQQPGDGEHCTDCGRVIRPFEARLMLTDDGRGPRYQHEPKCPPVSY